MENTGLFVLLIALMIFVGGPIILKLMSWMETLSYSVDGTLTNTTDFYRTLRTLKQKYQKTFWKVNRKQLAVFVLSNKGWELWRVFALDVAKRQFLLAHGFLAKSTRDGLCYVATGYEDFFDYDEIFKEESI